MIRRNMFGRLLLPFLMLIIAVSCSDSTTSVNEPDSEDPPPEINAACENLSIVTDSAQPTDIVSVTGFSSEFGDEAVALVSDPDNAENEVPIVFFADFSEKKADFVVPLHPTNQMDGGSVEIEFVQEDEDFSCPGFTFTIESLNPSPNATQEFVESYGNGLKQILEGLGYTSEELAGFTTQDVDTIAVPFLMAHHAIDSDLFENNLSAIMDGTAPLLNGTPLTSEQKQIIDALVARSNIEQYLNEYITTIASQLDNLPAKDQMQLKGEKISRNGVTLDTPAYLSGLMKSQREAEDLVTGFTGAALQASALTTGLVSLIAGLATVGTGGGASPATVPVGVAAGWASTAIATTLFVTQALSDLLPSRLVSFDLYATEYTFNEDSETIAKWENLMTVESRDFEVSVTDIIGFVGAGKVLDNKFVKDRIGEINQRIVEIFAEMNLAIVGGYDGTGIIAYEKNRWVTGVNTSRDNEEKYFKWEFDFLDSWDGSPPVFAFCSACYESTNGYYPLKQGESELRVEAIAEEFGFITNPVSTQEIAVEPIEIEITPQDAEILLEEVENGKGVALTAKVENADDPTLAWKAEGGYFTVHDDYENNVTYYPPAEVGNYLVTAEAMTETGPRDGREPTRDATSRIYVEDEDEGCAHFDSENAKTVTVEASGSYADTDSPEFSIAYALIDADEDSESACSYNGAVFEDDVSLPWSFEKQMSPPFSASINLTGLEDHTNNMRLRIYVDGEVVAEYNMDGFLESGEVEPYPALVYSE